MSDKNEMRINKTSDQDCDILFSKRINNKGEPIKVMRFAPVIGYESTTVELGRLIKLVEMLKEF